MVSQPETKNNRVLLGLVIIIFVGVFIIFITGTKFDITSSSNVLSISQVQLVDNTGGQLPAQKLWRVNLVVGTGGGESLYGSTSTQQNLQDGTQQSQESLLVSTKGFSSSCDYNLAQENVNSPSYQKIINIPMKVRGTSPSGALDLICSAVLFGGQYETTLPRAVPSQCIANMKDWCGRDGGVPVSDLVDNPIDIFGNKLSIRSEQWQCIKLTTDTSKPVYFYSSPNPKISNSVTLEVKKGSSTKQFTLTNSNPSYRDSDIYAYKLPGGLLDYNGGCPEASSLEFVRTSNTVGNIYSSGQYRTISKTAYTGIGGLVSISSATSRAAADQAVNQYNNKIDASLASTLYPNGLPFFSSDGKTGSFVISSNSIQKLNPNSPSLPTAAAYPLVSLDISADWLQILRQEATPKIQVSPQSCSFTQNGEIKSVSVDVKNTGAGEGTIRTSIACNGISVSPNTPIAQNYPAGTTLSNQFTLTSTNQGQFSCTVLAVNAGDTQRDQAQFNCLVNKQCDKVATGNYVLDTANCQLICPKLTCSENTVFDGNTCSCIPKTSNSGSCKPDTAQPTNTHWDINVCKWQCDSGYSATLDAGCIKDQVPQQNSLLKFIQDNLFAIVIVILVIGGFWWATSSNKKTKGGHK